MFAEADQLGRPGRLPMKHAHGGYLVTDPQRRIEARHWFLEDHGNLVAAQTSHFGLRESEEVALHEPDATCNPRDIGRQEAHD